MIFIILLLKYKIPDIGAMIYSLEKKNIGSCWTSGWDLRQRAYILVVFTIRRKMGFKNRFNVLNQTQIFIILFG